MFHFQGRDGEKAPRERQEFTFRHDPPRPLRFSHPKTSARPLLLSNRETTPEQLRGQTDGDDHAKYLDTDDLTDSDEAEMEVSDSAADDQEPPRKKQGNTNDDASIPKWSNPDPYTALPPPDESQKKKRDVVQLIRKARLAATQTLVQENAVTANADFISFRDDAGESSDDYEPPEGAPTGPSSMRNGNTALGNRKRTHDDEIRAPAPGKRGKAAKAFNQNGSILNEWRPLQQETATPWYKPDDSISGNPSLALHKEIIDFYHWVKPLPFEDGIRADLIRRLQTIFEQKFAGCRLESFGSFAAGLYLPIADMDLVLLSHAFMHSRMKHFCQAPKQIYQFSGYLQRQNVAVPGSVETIAHAKVPIIKFVDQVTGLKVDLSFDNDTGIVANGTFQTWKAQYPIMPIIVSIIKQFLMIRGLNDVSKGGLGGFSIICLVTSFLQLNPAAAGPNPTIGSLLMEFFNLYGNYFDTSLAGISLNPPQYFNKRLYSGFSYNKNKETGLAIIDPNRGDNDISGGTKEIPLIFKCFTEAHKSLGRRMASASRGPPGYYNGLLGGILAGNYTSFQQQRNHLQALYESNMGPTSRYPLRSSQQHSLSHPLRNGQQHSVPTRPQSPPPAPPIENPPPLPVEKPPQAQKAPQVEMHPPPSKPPPAKDTARTPKMERKMQAAYRRAEKFQTYRPDIDAVPDFLTVNAALTLGGYKDNAEMERDLQQREQRANKGGQ